MADNQDLQQQIDALKKLVNKNSYTNLYVFDTPVKFRRPNIYTIDNTPVFGSKGRIKINLTDGSNEYIPYYDAGAVVPTITTGSYVSVNTSSSAGVSSSQNVDTTFTCNFQPSSITLYYFIQATVVTGTVAGKSGIAFFNGTTGVSNLTLQTLSGSTYTLTNPIMTPSAGTNPQVGDGGTNDQTTLSILSVSPTNFVVRIAFHKGTTWNGSCYANFIAVAHI